MSYASEPYEVIKLEYICPKCKTVISIPEKLVFQPKSKFLCPKCRVAIDLSDKNSFDSEKIAKVIRQMLNSDLN